MNDALRTLLRFELVQVVRDRRTVMLAVVAPILLFPGIILLDRLTTRADESRRVEATYRVAVTGPAAADAGRLVDRARALPDSLTDGEPFLLETVETATPVGDLEAGELHLVLEGLEPDGPVPAFRILFRASSDISSAAASRLGARLEVVRTRVRDSLYRAGGLPVDPDDVLPLRSENVASAEREGGVLLGLVLPPIVVLLMLSGGSIVAADALSGEKERGTLETLLTTAVSRREIVLAKGLAIVTVGIVIGIVNLVNLGVWIGFGLFELPAAMDVSVTLGGLLLILLLFLPVAGLVAAALLLVSGWAKSYREYQLYFFPVFLAALLPTAVGFLPGLELRSAIVLAPLANVSLAIRDVLAGRPDLLFALLSALVTGAAALGLGRWAEATLSTERLLADSRADRAELLGGRALFPYRVLRAFGLLWVALLGISVWFGEDLGIRGQVLSNVVGLFLGGSLVLIHRYRLPIRETLALRRVSPLVWPAVLIGAPSAFVLGIGFAELTGRFIPVPPRVLEAFGQFLLPEGMGIVETVLLLAVLPGICEEIAFRGVLLNGLRQRMGPVAAALATGAIFGLFHVSLFRIVPTAYLGVVLAGVVLLTGSIWPAMLWHALNNAVALVPAWAGWIDPTAGVPVWGYATAAVGLVVAFDVLRRVGRRYPVSTPGGGPGDGRPKPS